MATKKKTKKAEIDLDFDFDLIIGTEKKSKIEPEAKPKKKVKKKAKKDSKAKPEKGSGKDPGQIEIERLAQKFPVALASEVQKPASRESQVVPVEARPMSVVGRGQDEIHDMIEEGRWDEVQGVMYKRMAQSLSSLLPYLEGEIRNTSGKKGAFNYNAMITTVRDLLGDIQQAQDRGRLGELIVDKLLRPAFMDVGMIFIKEHDMLQSRLRQSLDSEQMRVMQIWLDESQRRFVDQIQDEFRKLHEKVKEFLER